MSLGENTGSGDHELSDFLLRACHDLRAPVRAIRAHAELFLRDPAPAQDTAERLGFIVEGARKIDRLVDALSSYSLALRIDAESFQILSMGAALRTALARLDKVLRDANAKVTYGELPRVRGNPDRLIELVEQLLRNAIEHHGPAAPAIQMTAEEQPEGCIFAIRDNGPGVEAAYLETIFEPFEHAHTGQREGTGMGLAIARAIVARHGGRIWAESQPGNGFSVFFTLPKDLRGGQ